ncbi:MAG: CsbD family protein [Caulobacter sp.]|nr:CsbD family protein [Caulobacter sp.]
MWDRVEGSWKEFTGKVKEQWGKLTDDDMTVIAGKRDQLAGKIQERYGYATDKAESEIRDFEAKIKAEPRSFDAG